METIAMNWQRWRVWRRAGGLIGLVLALALGGARASSSQPAGNTSADTPSTTAPVEVEAPLASLPVAPAEIRSLELKEGAPGSLIEMQTSDAVVWTSYRDSADDLVLEFSNTRPSDTVGNVSMPGGLVDSVVVEIDDGDRPVTRLVISTRAEAEHSVRADGSTVRVELVPVDPAWTGGVAYPVAMEPPMAPNEEPVVYSAQTTEPVFADPAPADPEPPMPPQAPQSAYSGDPASRLEHVDASFDGDLTVVRIRGDGEFYYTTFTLEAPERFVVDLIGVVNASPERAIPVGSGLVDRIRIAQFKPQPELVSRVVVDLNRRSVAQIDATSDGIEIYFRSADTSSIASSSTLLEDLSENGLDQAARLEDDPYEESTVVEAVVVESAMDEAVGMGADENGAVGPNDPSTVTLAQVEQPVVEERAVEGPATEEPAAEVYFMEPAGADPVAEVAAVAQADEPVQVEEEPVSEAPVDPAEEAPVFEAPPTPVEAPISPAVESEPEYTEPDYAESEYSEPAYAEPAAAEDTVTQEDLFAPTLVNPGPIVQPGLGGGETTGFKSRSAADSGKVYRGEPMTLSLKDGEIKDVLRSFAQISGLNVVVQPQVSGTVTVELTNVPWDQALEQILKINGLGYELEGNIMRVAPRAQLRSEAEEEQRMIAARALSVPLDTVMKRVSYADAGMVANLLRSGGGASLMSQRGSVVVDARTNTLIIKELPAYMDTLISVIENLDTPEPQVMIEARIVETTKRFSRSLGIEWDFSGVSSAATGNTTGLVFPNNGTVDGGVSLLTGAANGFLDISLGNILNTFTLDATLQAAESEGLINILSAPRITTLNNERAEIQSGLQIPIQTVANNTVSVQFVNATLRLEVTPHVTAEGTVLMDIAIQKREPQLAFAVVGATNAPIATKDARTRVIVRDGGTTVIGGIYKVSSDQGEDRVPGLANVPIIGYLFKNKRRLDENEELLIFITPRVVRI